ncbi:MAG: hypothetical protein R3F11_28625 [Verrucomicrobiales bacterium]
MKKNAYRRNGVCEYLVLLVREAQVIWWSLEGGEYAAIEPEDGVLKSRRFPGLWLDPRRWSRATSGGSSRSCNAASPPGTTAPSSRRWARDRSQSSGSSGGVRRG